MLDSHANYSLLILKSVAASGNILVDASIPRVHALAISRRVKNSKVRLQISWQGFGSLRLQHDSATRSRHSRSASTRRLPLYSFVEDYEISIRLDAGARCTILDRASRSLNRIERPPESQTSCRVNHLEQLVLYSQRFDASTAAFGLLAIRVDLFSYRA
jgi:hypothetical protein